MLNIIFLLSALYTKYSIGACMLCGVHRAPVQIFTIVYIIDIIIELTDATLNTNL